MRRTMTPNTVNGLGRKPPNGARTRSMSGGQLYLPSGLLGTTAEDGGNPVRCNNTIKPVLTTVHKECNGSNKRRHSLPRRSQLAVLSDEAQNFMFRESIHSSSASSSNEDEEERISIKLEPGLENSTERKRKRRSQAEAFIADNREYYKFETPGSRLRFHEDNKDTEQLARDHDFTFSFERVPHSEPWYQTYQRQDRGEEFYYSMPMYEPPFLLPYQLPPLLPSGIKKGRRRRLLKEKKPRKSPRCHASTLAILSGFIQRRKKEPSKLNEEQPEVLTPPTLGETVDDMVKLAEKFEKELEMSGDEVDLVVSGESLTLSLSKNQVPVLSLLGERCEFCFQTHKCEVKVDKWRTRKKKKRKNLTGWPNTKKAKIPNSFHCKKITVKEEPLSVEEYESASYTSCDLESVESEVKLNIDGCKGKLEDCRVPNTRRLRSAKFRRESPRKVRN